MNMRPSRVLQKLRNGEVVNCVKQNLACSRVTEIAGMKGFDCIWVDMEHVASDWSLVERQILAAKTQNMDVLVRVERGSYSDYVKPFELDASGIMVPHVMSLADAKHVVRTTRFHPIGRRPVDGGNADGAYCNIDFVEYLKQSGEQKFVIIQIEDPEPLAELDAICALDGIDVIFFGPGDFSHGIGAAGQWNDPRIAQARKQIVETALRHGKIAGTVGGLDNMNELLDMGYRFLSIGADVVAVSQYFGGLVDGWNKNMESRASKPRKSRKG